MTDILGWIGTVGLMGFYIPQLVSLMRAPRVEGFNIYAWCSLLVAVDALAFGALLIGWWAGAVANGISAVAVVLSIYYMRRKS